MADQVEEENPSKKKSSITTEKEPVSKLKSESNLTRGAETDIEIETDDKEAALESKESKAGVATGENKKPNVLTGSDSTDGSSPETPEDNQGQKPLPAKLTGKMSKKTDKASQEDEEEVKRVQSDFGQGELERQRKTEADLFKKKGSWANDGEEETTTVKEDKTGRSGSAVTAGEEMEEPGTEKESKKDTGGDEEPKKVRRKRRQPSVITPKKEELASSKRKKGKKEAEGEEQGKQEQEKVWVEPNYISDDFLSGPILASDEVTVPASICQFLFSYGYDSTRRSNLHVLDDETIVYISGNYLHFYSIRLKKVLFVKRSVSGYGLGHIAVHPSRQYFAVGEKGDNPYVIIYTWPELKIYRILRKGTTRGFAFVNFNPSGELICSLGMAPDYMLTIWNWEFEKIVLRAKAYSQDIYRATFSPTNPGDLTTCGLGHIRFWKMAETFTGLKLQGLIGRFGKTEISDIQDYCSLSDGKIISGSEWGNMLIWDYGLIVVEITLPGGKLCHNGEISELKLHEGELISIGADGYLRIWETELLDLADTVVDDSGKVEVEPIHELRLSSTAKLTSAVKATQEEQNLWFLQDAFGKVWSVNLALSIQSPEYQADTLFYAPGGAINALCVCPGYTVMAVGSQAGHLWLIEYINKECLARKFYSEAVTQVIWLPLKYDPRGLTLLAGFGDGTVRVLSLQKLTDDEMKSPEKMEENEGEVLPFVFWPVQILRYHKGGVLVLHVDFVEDILYCCGADKVIFGSKLLWDEAGQKVILIPLSFVTAPFPVTSIDLHPLKNYRMIIGSKTGRVAECRRPIWGDMDTSISYNQGKLHGRRWFYKSVKSARRREERRESRKLEKEEKLEELYADFQRRRELNLPVDEELEVGRLNDQYRRAQHEDDEQELYIPPNPCPVLGIYYCINKDMIGPNTGKTFFMHVGGYDSGYVYECKCTRDEPGGFHSLPPTPPFKEDLGVRSYIIGPYSEYLIFGMTDGTIRVMPKAKASPEQPKAKKEVRKSVRINPTISADRDDSDENEEGDEQVMGTGFAPEVPKKKKTSKVISPFPTSFYPYDLKNFWTLPMHDPDRGAVTALCFSQDYEFLFSAGEDGSIFAYRWDTTGKLVKPTDNLPQPYVPVIRYEQAPLVDSESLSALTLEELKKKREDDRVNSVVESKREVIRKELRRLKMDFRALVQRNSEIPEQQRVARKKFEIDPRIREPRHKKQIEEIEDIYRRLEWRSLKSIIRYEKIEAHFLKDIATHYFIVKDLEHTTFVHTFRHRILTDKYWDIFEKNKTWMVEEEAILNAYLTPTEKEPPRPPPSIKRFYAKDLIGDFEGKKYDIKTIHAIRQLEKRLEKRYERQCEVAALNAEQIHDDYEDPKDAATIKWAVENMGDFKLRSSEDYTGERITVAARRQRVLNLKSLIFDKFHEFNQYVMLLKEEKLIMIEKCQELQEEIKQLQKYIPFKQRKPIPEIYGLDEIEKPEERYDITEQKIEARQNKTIAEAGLTKRKLALDEKMHGMPEDTAFPKMRKIRSFHEFESNWRKYKFDYNFPNEPVLQIIRKQRNNAASVSKIVTVVKPPPGLVLPVATDKGQKLDGLPNSIFRYRKTFFNPKTAAGIDRRDRALAHRLLAQDQLLEKLQGIIDYFKNRITAVRDERTELAIDMKVAQLALLVLCEELEVVREFDVAEKSILERRRVQQTELDSAKDRMDKVTKRLTRAKNEEERINQGIEAIQVDVAAIIAEKPRFTEYLWKVYKKKIREPRGQTDEEQADMRGTSSSSSSGGTSTSVDSSSDLFRLPKLKMDPNICPEVLEKTIYERVIELRTKRTLLEMEGEIQKKVVERISKDFEDIDKVYKKYEGRLDFIGQEMHVLNRKKQEKLNELNGFIIIRSDQIQCLEDDDTVKEPLQIPLPPDMPPGVDLEDNEDLDGVYGRFFRQFPTSINEIVVFKNNEVGKLVNRMQELKDETVKEKRKQRGARHMTLRLQEELRRKESAVKVLVSKCKEDMMGKFGRVVDMDEVCAVIINLDILDALHKLETRRNRQYYERGVIERQIEDTKRHLTAVTKVNSEFNSLLAILEERRRDVDYYLFRQNKLAELSQEKEIETTKVQRTNEEVENQLYELEYQLIRQEMKIQTLRETIAIAKCKIGIPPLISMHKIPDKYGDTFMTYDELRRYNHEINYEVEMLYVKENIMEHLQKSESDTPNFIAKSGEDLSMLQPVDLDESAPLSAVEEVDEGQESEMLVLEEEIGGEDEYATPYHLNVIDDDQMSESNT